MKKIVISLVGALSVAGVITFATLGSQPAHAQSNGCWQGLGLLGGKPSVIRVASPCQAWASDRPQRGSSVIPATPGLDQ